MNTLFQSISQLESPLNGLVMIFMFLGLAGTVTAVAAQVRKIVAHLIDVRFKRELVERGLSVDEIERLLATMSIRSFDRK